MGDGKIIDRNGMKLGDNDGVVLDEFGRGEVEDKLLAGTWDERTHGLGPWDLTWREGLKSLWSLSWIGGHTGRWAMDNDIAKETRCRRWGA